MTIIIGNDDDSNNNNTTTRENAPLNIITTYTTYTRAALKG